MLKLATFLTFILITNGAKFAGSIETQKDGHIAGFSFIGKFCFGYKKVGNESFNWNNAAGYVTLDLNYLGYNKNNTILAENRFYIVFYDDQAGSWDSFFDQSMTCQDALETTGHRINDEILFTSNFYEYKTAIHEQIRPRWWWVYVVQCDTSNKLMDFDISFEQNEKSLWYKQAGSNDRGLNTMWLVFLVIYIILFGIQAYAYHVFKVQQYVHQIIKLLTLTMFFALFSVLLNFIDWMIFTETGEHEIFFPIVADLTSILASTIFLLLLIVLAQGWTISRFEVVYPKLLLLLMIIVFVSQCVFYVVRLIDLDPEQTVYFYNSWPAMAIGALFILIGIYFIFQSSWSLKNEPSKPKKKLYCGIMIYFIWFCFPLCQIFIGNLFSEWRRDIAITSLIMGIQTISFGVMMLLMWPKWAHQYFNLSMKDTQLSMLENDGNNGASSSNRSKNDYQVLEQDRL